MSTLPGFAANVLVAGMTAHTPSGDTGLTASCLILPGGIPRESKSATTPTLQTNGVARGRRARYVSDIDDEEPSNENAPAPFLSREK